MTFTEKLQRAITSSQSVLCVGLDPDLAKIPAPLKEQFRNPSDQVFEFCRRVIESTKMHTCAYKPNLAFFEALGSDGWTVFDRLMDEIPSGKIIIADAKRGDIGTTAQKYKEAFFDKLGVDAITLNPLMGMDTLDPFLDDDRKAVFVLTMTSNPGSSDFLQLPTQEGSTLGTFIAKQLREKQETAKTHIGMVVGATNQQASISVLKASPNSHLLIPGIGAQGGNIDTLATTLKDHKGIPIISSSRSIIYAGEHAQNWEELVSSKAAEMKESLTIISKKYV
ncbi:MAG: orotidine-5'-phosphate decarboxylase [Balneolaceae bacterium]